eukprot:EC818611.1.p1 GENE.EC818611.1~~EC818611.1.p1  ORF type:complete len:53 (+),score=14.56 EC818611.1:85-243(+)
MIPENSIEKKFFNSDLGDEKLITYKTDLSNLIKINKNLSINDDSEIEKKKKN